MEKILLYYHQMQYEYLLNQFEYFEENDIEVVERMYVDDVHDIYSFLGKNLLLFNSR